MVPTTLDPVNNLAIATVSEMPALVGVAAPAALAILQSLWGDLS